MKLLFFHTRNSSLVRTILKHSDYPYKTVSEWGYYSVDIGSGISCQIVKRILFICYNSTNPYHPHSPFHYIPFHWFLFTNELLTHSLIWFPWNFWLFYGGFFHFRIKTIRNVYSGKFQRYCKNNTELVVVVI